MLSLIGTGLLGLIAGSIGSWFIGKRWRRTSIRRRHGVEVVPRCCNDATPVDERDIRARVMEEAHRAGQPLAGALLANALIRRRRAIERVAHRHQPRRRWRQ